MVMASRALVLGGGGPVGIAWESGLIAGLLDGGVDLREADFMIGTSAGSFVGSQLAGGRDMRLTLEAIEAEAARQSSAADVANVRPAGERPAAGAPASGMMRLMELMGEAAAGKRPAEEVRRELGAFALSAQTVDEDTFIKSFGRGLAEHGESWPEKRFACTAVDTATGDFQLWDNDSDVPLAKAVASSCSVPGVYPPITINGKRYMDGGMRSGTNADLATGYDRVLVIALRIGGTEGEQAQRQKAVLDREIKVLEDAGAKVGWIFPDEASQAAFGANLMNARTRPASARAGYAQGKALAATLKPEWAG
jgi:NTE family protein